MEIINELVEKFSTYATDIFGIIAPYREALSTTFKLSAILAVPNIIVWLICCIIFLKYGRELEEDITKKIKRVKRITFFVSLLWIILGIILKLTNIYCPIELV